MCLISIVIPVYNSEKYLEECFLSVINQITDNMPEIEIIFVDDGSKDRSGQMCDEYAAQTENIMVSVIHQENKGSYLARREGCINSKGKYILCLDSDDMIQDNALLKLIDCINKCDSDVIFYNISFLSNGKRTPYYFDVFTSLDMCDLDINTVIESIFLSMFPVVTSTGGKIFKRTCITKEKEISIKQRITMGDDTFFSLEIFSNAKTFKYFNSNIYLYRVGIGMTSRFDPNYFNKYKVIFDEMLSYDYLTSRADINELFNYKVLSTACRAITQTKYYPFSYKERKAYIKSIYYDKLFHDSLNNFSFRKNELPIKYIFIICLLKMKAFLILHIILTHKTKYGR